MWTKAVSVAFLGAAVTAVVICAIFFWEPITQPGRPTKEIAHRPRHAAIELALTKENGSPQANEDPPPETTTIVISSSRTYPAGWPAAPLVTNSPQLVRQLQQELKRLGCYSHEINGDWTPATRAAMKDFLDRANAVLPLGAPDAAHLALLKGQSEPLCGTSCPSGQTLAKGNHCLPSALIPLATKHASIARTTTGSEASNTLVDGSAVSPAPPARVPRVRRAPSPPKYGSGFFGLFGF